MENPPKNKEFKSPFLWLFRFEISLFVPFWIKNPQNLSNICKKGTNCEIFKSKLFETRALKVHVIQQKSTDGGTYTKNNSCWTTGGGGVCLFVPPSSF